MINVQFPLVNIVQVISRTKLKLYFMYKQMGHRRSTLGCQCQREECTRFDSVLQEQLTKRILVWDGNNSQGGKEMLIKAVAQSIPTYLMGVFKLPMAICDDLTRMIQNFWWGSKEGKRKTHWKGWDC
jgi:hypothetical protein